ncbi:D-aminoacylase [Sphingomonas sp.]|uniref:N-acyl-D-amino-acid deacylase family protein n=1 Tax=Sphingomonas sp. TaxID=28214 RepID=UPI00286BD395|nr:D-aminoacylase [Sphingomonas sp.]
MIGPTLRLAPLAVLLASCTSINPAPGYDLIIRGGTIVDGSGGQPFTGDVGISGDRIVAVAQRLDGVAPRTIDATGLAVAPGFINMLSWATESLIEDGAGESDIRQGVTLEVMGEGNSMGPYNETMVRLETERQADIKYPIDWRTLGQYLTKLEQRGIAPNVASFVGATTVRVHTLGEGDVDPTPAQLAAMQNAVRLAMNEGAMGVGSSLIYAPAFYAETPELIALAAASAQCGGMYISHMRNESDNLLEAVDELIEIARKSGGPAEIYHLKQAGKGNWSKLDAVIARVEAARASGVRITADMYNYVAGATGLDAAMPPWVQAGGYEEWKKRLQDPAIRKRVLAEMRARPVGWESLYWQAGSAEKLILIGFKNEKLKSLTGKTLAEVARMRGTSPEDTAIDMVIEDGSRVSTAYFLMDEANVARQVALPWMSFGSDAEAQAPVGKFLKSSVHPRAYGNFARLLGQYVRDEQRLTLPDAVRRLTSYPAANLGIKDRGLVQPGMMADLAIFDPATIADQATFDKPQQFAVGMRHVLVNGQPVLLNGAMTTARPGRAVRGPGTGRCPPR